MKTQTAINETARNNAIKAEEIYQAHKAAFINNELPYGATNRKECRQDLTDALLVGELFPEIWRQMAIHTLTPYQRIGLCSLLAFSSPAAEKKFKASFIACVENLLNV